MPTPISTSWEATLSTQYIVTQGNFQVATSYTYRF